MWAARARAGAALGVLHPSRRRKVSAVSSKKRLRLPSGINVQPLTLKRPALFAEQAQLPGVGTRTRLDVYPFSQDTRLTPFVRLHRPPVSGAPSCGDGAWVHLNVDDDSSSSSSTDSDMRKLWHNMSVSFVRPVSTARSR